MLVSYRPAPPLASHVEMLWHYDGQPTASHRETVLPNGKFQITINLASGHGTVCGIRSQHSVIETAAIPAIIGIVLRPGGARAFFGAPANDFLNKTLPLESVWGWRAAQLRNQLLEAGTVGSQFRVLENGLLSAMGRAGEAGRALHPAVAWALGELTRVPPMRSVIELARASGLSRRRFSQIFNEQVGITPKVYGRLHRFLEIVRRTAAGGPVDWADVALAGGYFDQAHMAHEFQQFSGLSPGRYLAAERPHRYHIRIQRAQVK